MMLSTRKTFLLMALYTLTMMATALIYFQNYLGYEPCVLCVAQRIATITIGVIALIAFTHGKATRVYASLLVLASGAGAAIAGRHVWIQSLPEDEVPLCGPSFDYIVDAFPLRDALEMILLGDGSCADVHWDLLGLSIPAWTLIAFLGLLGLAIFQLIRRGK
ncbi:MAG: disulfide bond formation protein B [Pseudomonadales bacterium]